MSELDLPAPVRAELTRLRAERVVHVAERERLLEQLRTADTNLRAAIDRQHRLAEQAQLTEETRELAAQAQALGHDLEQVRRQRDELRAELSTTRRERDRVRLQLLDSELLLHGEGRRAADAEHRAQFAQLRAADAERELAATRATLSWRITAPLRMVRRWFPPR
jgi:uncharacterized protein (UPF0335 family)